MLGALDLNALTIDQEPLGLEAVGLADQLTRVRKTQRSYCNDNTEYQLTDNGTIVVNGRVAVPDVQELRDEILKENH